MSKVIAVDVFVHLNLNYIRDIDANPALALQYFHSDMSDNSYFKGEYVFIEKKTINVLVPDESEIAGLAAEALEAQLSRMRADHHREQQKLIDQIASYRMLAAPKSGELLDDNDLRAPSAPSKFHDADQAEEVKEDDDNAPF